MVVYHWHTGISDIYFLQGNYNKAWSVGDSCAINDSIKPYLLFLHVFSGCDTTSAIFNQEAEKIVSLLIKSEDIREIAEVISSPWSTQSDVGNASVKAMEMLYGKIIVINFIG